MIQKQNADSQPVAIIGRHYLRGRQTDRHKNTQKNKDSLLSRKYVGRGGGIGGIGSHFYPRHYMEMSGQFQ